jgi:hypothetical protein
MLSFREKRLSYLKSLIHQDSTTTGATTRRFSGSSFISQPITGLITPISQRSSQPGNIGWLNALRIPGSIINPEYFQRRRGSSCGDPPQSLPLPPHTQYQAQSLDRHDRHYPTITQYFRSSPCETRDTILAYTPDLQLIDTQGFQQDPIEQSRIFRIELEALRQELIVFREEC